MVEAHHADVEESIADRIYAMAKKLDQNDWAGDAKSNELLLTAIVSMQWFERARVPLNGPEKKAVRSLQAKLDKADKSLDAFSREMHDFSQDAGFDVDPETGEEYKGAFLALHQFHRLHNKGANGCDLS